MIWQGESTGKRTVPAVRCGGHTRKAGFGLLGLVVMLIVILVPLLAITPHFFQRLSMKQEISTQEQLSMIKQAVAGNSRLVVNEGRTDFGYTGNMGGIPGKLEDLYLKGTTQPDFVFSTTARIGAGWLGPYLPIPILEGVAGGDEDAYNLSFDYITTEFTRDTDSQVVSARIRSRGPDNTAGTSDDLVIDILRNEVFATVTGRVMNQGAAGPGGGQPMEGATVTLNLPVSGALSTREAVTDASGVYTFTNVSFGIRSMQVNPVLSYAAGSARVRANRDLIFKITNFGKDAVSFNSMKAEYTPLIFYEKVKIGNNFVFDYNSNTLATLGLGVRAGSGDTLTFAAQSVNGSGKPAKTILARVDRPSVSLDDLIVSGSGGTATIELQNFVDAKTGTASTVSPSGVTFTFTFGHTDGKTSKMTFTAP